MFSYIYDITTVKLLISFSHFPKSWFFLFSSLMLTSKSQNGFLKFQSCSVYPTYSQKSLDSLLFLPLLLSVPLKYTLNLRDFSLLSQNDEVWGTSGKLWMSFIDLVVNIGFFAKKWADFVPVLNAWMNFPATTSSCWRSHMRFCHVAFHVLPYNSL